MYVPLSMLLTLDARVKNHFTPANLDPTAINTIYAHVLNPMVVTRSYMCVEPIQLFLNTKALRRGIVQLADPDFDPYSLLIHDSGMVPVSTQIAIVNPETCTLSRIGEFGEIWVASESNVKGFYRSKDPFDLTRMTARISDGDPRATYVRTGDLGFLYNVSRPVGPGGAVVDMQTLFVLGSIGETFEVNGLNHFPMDIERTIERSHRKIVRSGSAVFQAGGQIVGVIEVLTEEYLAALVPLIINAVLNEHQVVIDVIAFVARGDFPRSRLGEKQRGKILSHWVTRKLYAIPLTFLTADARLNNSRYERRICGIRGVWRIWRGLPSRFKTRLIMVIFVSRVSRRQSILPPRSRD
jgi:acyl-CoA synthetase (AMP-forming)/AMP-acid ligase II